MPIWETDFDFGITRIASVFHQDWVRASADAGSVVAEHLSAQHGAPLISVLERDASSLACSIMSDSQLSDLWNASTDGYHPLPPGPSGGRAWMAVVANLAQRRLRQLQVPYDPKSTGPLRA